MITLQQIRDQHPCKDGWEKVFKAYGPDLTRQISIGDIVVSNGLDDALWALRCLTPRERVAAVMPAVRRASVHTTDPRVAKCIAAIGRWLAGDDSVDLETAADAARDAAWAAAASAAASAADAATDAAWATDAADAADAATDAADAAASAADAATDAAWAADAERADAAWAEREAQKADLLAMFPRRYRGVCHGGSMDGLWVDCATATFDCPDTTDAQVTWGWGVPDPAFIPAVTYRWVDGVFEVKG